MSEGPYETAMMEGVTEDEILDALIIAAIIGQTKVLAQALRSFEELDSGSDNKT